MRPLIVLESWRHPVVPSLVVVGADLLCLGLRGGHRRLLEREIGGLEISFQMHCREIKSRTDVVEASGGAVLRQQITQWRIDAQ